MRTKIRITLALFFVLVISSLAYAVPTVSLISPNDGDYTSLHGITFTYSVSDNLPLKNCSLLVDDAIKETNTNVPVGQPLTFISLLEHGEHKWKIGCINNNSEFGISPSYDILVDLNPPVLSDIKPDFIVDSPTVTLEVRTDENATCRYSASGTNYNNMGVFSKTGLRLHSHVLTGLSDNIYTYNVGCNDSLGNIAQTTIDFEVSLPPTAEIELSDSSPIKAGTIEVKLTTSKDMLDPPTLTYKFDTDGGNNPVSLTGYGKDWMGYIVVEDKDEKKVGSFHFTGKDLKGVTGDFITEGNLFIVDTIEPSVPTNLEAIVGRTGIVRLYWYYDDEDVAYYIIHRSTSAGIDNLDNYTNFNGTEFIDDATLDKVTYYYRVSVVDLAGNKGPLSSEVYATSVVGGSQVQHVVEEEDEEEDIPRVLPPKLVIKVDDYIKRLDNLLIDVKSAVNSISSKQDSNIKELISDLGIPSKIEGLDSKINDLKSTLVSLKSTYKTESELDNELHKIDMEITKILTTTPKDITLIEYTEFVQTLSDPDVSNAVDELFGTLSFTEEQKKKYTKNSVRNKDEVSVQTKIKVLTIEYLDSSTSKKTLIKKRLFHENIEPFNDVLVIEMIPKEVSETTADIDFITSDYEVIKDDPVLKWGFLELDSDGEEIMYVVNKHVELDKAKKAKSIAMLEINKVGKTPVTGLSILPSGSFFGNGPSLFMWIGFLVIAVLLIYYYVFVRGGGGMISKAASKGRDKVTGLIPKKIKGSFSNFRNNSAKRGDSDMLLDEIHKNMKTTKEEVVDKLYPTFNGIYKMLESRGQGQSNTDSGDSAVLKMGSLIYEMESLLNQNETNRAAMLYPEINLIYRDLPKHYKSEFYGKCAELHSKITKV